jgi:predicted RNase H-like HicB family nuclease
MNSLEFYMNQKYKVEIIALPDDTFAAELSEVPGLCAYGNTEIEALMELELVKKTAFELMIEQNKEIPLPIRKFEIPVDILQELPFRKELERFAIV